MLVLLVIFIVTAKIIVTPAVPLDLPHAAHGDEVQVVFSVIVPLHGPVLVDGAALPNADDALAQKASVAIDGDPDLRAVIQADTATCRTGGSSMCSISSGARVSRASPSAPCPSRSMAREGARS